MPNEWGHCLSLESSSSWWVSDKVLNSTMDTSVLMFDLCCCFSRDTSRPLFTSIQKCCCLQTAIVQYLFFMSEILFQISLKYCDIIFRLYRPPVVWNSWKPESHFLSTVSDNPPTVWPPLPPEALKLCVCRNIVHATHILQHWEMILFQIDVVYFWTYV